MTYPITLVRNFSTLIFYFFYGNPPQVNVTQTMQTITAAVAKDIVDQVQLTVIVLYASTLEIKENNDSDSKKYISKT